MQKTDAELIAEVEKREWFLKQMATIPAESPEDKEAALLLGILPELARRLDLLNFQAEEIDSAALEAIMAAMSADTSGFKDTTWITSCTSL